jgi:hypothetical protein
VSRLSALALALSALALSACVAETIERRKPRMGPVKEVGFVDLGGGHVRYSTEGWGLWVAARRRAALRAMRRNCGKRLKPFVTDEYDREDADAVYSGEEVTSTMGHGGEHYRIGQFRHLTYECRDPKAPAAPVTPAPSAFLIVPSSAAAPAPAAPDSPAAPEPPKAEVGVSAPEAPSSSTETAR